MRSKLYFGTFIIALTLLGAVFQQQIAVPNQEIVLQFIDVETSSNEAQNTIANVKQQLLDLGIIDFQVLEDEKGRIKITYYSETDVASIKEKLSEEAWVNLDGSTNGRDKEPINFPFDDNSRSYNLDVFEIDNGNDSEGNLNGTFVFELDSVYDRYFNPKEFSSNGILSLLEKERIAKVALKVSRNVAIKINNPSYTTPEVRAGPAV